MTGARVWVWLAAVPPYPAVPFPRRLTPTLCAVIVCILGWTLPTAPAACAQPRGLPFIRTYPLDDIGNVPRGLRLGIDSRGRVAVMYDGVYSVLNDTAWVDRMESSSSRVRMTTVRSLGGRYFYGGRGSWGEVEVTHEGRFRPAPLVPANAPAWTAVTAFNNVICTPEGAFFYELNGVVYWDAASRTNHFYPMPRLSEAFLFRQRLIASCEDGSLHEIDPASGTTRELTVAGLDRRTVAMSAPLDSDQTLLLVSGNQLMVFDGQTVTPWGPQARHPLEGQVTALAPLAEGGVAVALNGKGLYLFNPEGTLRWALELPEFHRVSSMIAGEAGVVWALGENGVHRVYHESPVTGFGQRLGLSVSWPQIVPWDGTIAICSRQHLYRMEDPVPGHPTRFRPLFGPPEIEANQIASSGSLLLAANARQVYSVEPSGKTTPVLEIENTAGMEFVAPETCLIIGSKEIAAVRREGGIWRECAPRIPGIGDSPIAVQKHQAVWIEMGGDRVARLQLEHDRLILDPVALPWTGAGWTNVGAIGNTIILTGGAGQRCYYDENEGRLVKDARLDALLGRSPYWILRIREDQQGILWATHAQGLVTYTPQGGEYAIDWATYELRNDSYPRVHLFDGDDTWVSAGRSIYHVERSVRRKSATPQAQLVSVFADQKRRELLQETESGRGPARFSGDDNSLSFRFFSGTYAWISPPQYEYRLGSSEAWTAVDPSLVLRFPKLQEGAYRLEVRPAGPRSQDRAPFTYSFAIDPPWYRTVGVRVTAGGLALLGLAGIARWTTVRASKRTAMLERLVGERTRELERTMEQLGEETRNAATLAERTRLAGEIHDSVQQGLSGAILHLDTTMTHPSLSPPLHAQLDVVRNMLSYSREEVQQAVWNLESPLLHNSTLAAALQKLVTFINSGPATIEVSVPEKGATLEPAIQHNLLRIAQEALTNAVKHSGASRIQLSLWTHDDAVELTVSDNGRGFDPDLARSGKHFGLRGIHSRAKAIQATLTISSRPGEGTTVGVRLSRTHP